MYADIEAALKIKAYVEPNSFTIDMEGTRCALAYDGMTYSLVVAPQKWLIRCVAFEFRSMELSCEHARLTRGLHEVRPRSGDGDADGDARLSHEDLPGAAGEGAGEGKASVNFGKYGEEIDDREAILNSDVTRRKRNLLPSLEEDRLAELWLMTADLFAVVPDRGSQGL